MHCTLTCCATPNSFYQYSSKQSLRPTAARLLVVASSKCLLRCWGDLKHSSFVSSWLSLSLSACYSPVILEVTDTSSCSLSAFP